MCVCALVIQSCLILCDPKACNLPGSFVRGIPQGRILEWVAIPSPGDLPDLGIGLWSSALAGRLFFTVWATREAHVTNI